MLKDIHARKTACRQAGLCVIANFESKTLFKASLTNQQCIPKDIHEKRVSASLREKYFEIKINF